MKPLKDYGFVRGFNYTQSNVWTDSNFWEEYDHAIVDREMGYAERLRLNSARLFLTYASYLKDPKQFLNNVRDCVQTAWKRGISTNPIILCPYPDPKSLAEKENWKIGEKYFDDLYEAIGQEPGLLFWDIANEPGYRTPDNVTWYQEEPAYTHEFARQADLTELRKHQERVWEYVRHFCQYVKEKDSCNAIGIGNTFIYETEASKTAELVDIIVFHDYSETRARVREAFETAKALGEKYGKPVLNNETCCLCRANPYDMVLELCSEYKMGFYLFELMIGSDVWNRVHGVVYPDGTVRDPAIVAALMGFFRNRGQSAIATDVNQEGYAARAIILADKALSKARNGFGGDHSHDAGELLEVCEYIANLLESGQHVPMDNPPTSRVAKYRRQEKPDTDEIKAWLADLVLALKKACNLVM